MFILGFIIGGLVGIMLMAIVKVGGSKMEDDTVVCECQNCERQFEIEIKGNEEITCPYCHSGDVITYGSNEWYTKLNERVNYFD